MASEFWLYNHTSKDCSTQNSIWHPIIKHSFFLLVVFTVWQLWLRKSYVSTKPIFMCLLWVHRKLYFATP